MKPRERPSPPVPEKLARFVASEWPDENGISCWLRARLDFVEANPHTVLGDWYDAFAEARRLRRHLPGRPQPAQKDWRRDGDAE